LVDKNECDWLASDATRLTLVTDLLGKFFGVTFSLVLVGMKQNCRTHHNLFSLCSQNNLAGSLPEEMGVFTPFTFDIFSNRVGGTIPAALRALTRCPFDIESNF
jgi:hypothetical protein